MKKIFLPLIVSLSFLVFTNNAYSINEQYRSIADGNWSSTNIWLMSTNNGSTWISATTPPTSAAGSITINNNVIVNYDVEVDQLTNNDSLIIGTGVIMTLVDGPGTDLINGKVILGPGIIKTQGIEVTLATYHEGYGGYLKADLVVHQGLTKIQDALSSGASYYGSVTVEASCTLSNKFNQGLSLKNNVLNNGTIEGLGTISRNIDYYGGLVTNNGLISNCGIGNQSISFVNNGSVLNSSLNMGGNGFNQYLSGTGIFSMGGLNLGGGTIFLSDIYCDNGCGISGTASSFGVCDLNSHKLTINKGSIYYKFDIVPGSGTVETKDTVSLMGYWGGVTYDFSLRVMNGITNLWAVTMSRPIIVDSSATINFGNTTMNNDLTNYGTIGTQSSLNFYGSVFNNFGNVFLSSLNFYGNVVNNNGNITIPTFDIKSGIHTFYGIGSMTSSTLHIRNGSITTLTSNHKMGKIYIYSGGSFDISNRILSVSASNPLEIENGGILNSLNSRIEYNGTTNQYLSTANVTYKVLVINNPAGVTLFSSLTLTDSVILLNGDLNILGNILTLSPTAYLIETPGNTVTGTSGYIQTTQTLNAPSSYNPCGMGATLTTVSNLGSTIIKRGNTIQNNLNGTTSILRYFDITPTNNSGLNATLTFKYDDSELNGKPESSLQLFRSTNSGSNWTFRGGGINTASNEITLSGIDAFSRWTAGSGYLTSSIKVIPEGLYNSATNRLNRKDTVRAYLRNILSPYDIIDSAKSIIDSVTFSGSFIFTNAPSGNYYIQTKHRNSLETWSKAGGEVYNLGNAFSYDFTTASSQAFGNNMLQADASPVRYAIYSGDVNLDGSIDLTDITSIVNDASNFITGYVASDLNRDGIVDLTDLTITFNNSSNFVSVVKP